MSIYESGEVTREGFAFGYGRFFANPGRVEVVSGQELRAMFLPKMTAEGRKKIRDNGCFVRGQLKHYDVSFKPSELSGKETNLLKKALLAGKCDKVPDHIVQLREAMTAEWLGQQTLKELSVNPDWAMQRYFLTDGRPDRLKTPGVVGMPMEPHSQYRAGQMREAAAGVAGLYHETGYGPKTQTIFMGWNATAVKAAAKTHAAKESKEMQAEKDAEQEERAEAHDDYLKTLGRRKGNKGFSPVGSYIIDCDEIAGNWPRQAADMSLDIAGTDRAGIFKASFQFGILEGVMILGTDEHAVDRYCAALDDEDGQSDYIEDEDEDERPAKGSKRKRAPASRGRGRPPKKAKTVGAGPIRTYSLRLKCREIEGQVYSTASMGAITFDDEKLASFEGWASFPCVGSNVPFRGRKVADVPGGEGHTWSMFSESVYYKEQRRRWC